MIRRIAGEISIIKNERLLKRTCKKIFSVHQAMDAVFESKMNGVELDEEVEAEVLKWSIHSTIILDVRR